MADLRGSARIKSQVLDDITRSRRAKKALEALERDNFQETLSSPTKYVSDYRLNLNKKFQQRFQVETDDDDSEVIMNTSNEKDNKTTTTTTDELATMNPNSLNDASAAAALKPPQPSQSTTSTPTSSSSTTIVPKKRKLKQEMKFRFRRNFASLIEEEHALNSDKKFNYFSIKARPSKFPARKFCAVCGFKSTYTCCLCGTKYCSSKCLLTHQETRCLKWTA